MEEEGVYFRVCAVHPCYSCVKHKSPISSLSRCLASLNAQTSRRVKRISGKVFMDVVCSAGSKYNDRKGNQRHLSLAGAVRNFLVPKRIRNRC